MTPTSESEGHVNEESEEDVFVEIKDEDIDAIFDKWLGKLYVEETLV